MREIICEKLQTVAMYLGINMLNLQSSTQIEGGPFSVKLCGISSELDYTLHPFSLPQAEFSGGVLVCNGVIALRRVRGNLILAKLNLVATTCQEGMQ